MPHTKKKRQKKVSKGINGGGGKVKLTTVQKALMGKGIIASAKPASARNAPKKKLASK